MSYGDLPQSISASLLDITDNPVVVLILINILLLLVGIFMDITPAILIFTPIFLPVVQSFGIDPIHFGIIMVLNLCIGLCTPPVGNLLFVGASVANISFQKILKPMLPLYVVMLLVLVLIMLFPQLSYGCRDCLICEKINFFLPSIPAKLNYLKRRNVENSFSDAHSMSVFLLR